MINKKHIDRLFQEGFKDFEATPSDAVWKNIAATLSAKKGKRRVIPIWWRYAGIAALLLLLLTVGGIFLNEINEGSTNQVVDNEKNAPLNDGNKTNTIAVDNNTQNDLNDSNDDLNTPSKVQSETITDKINLPKEASIAETSTSKNKSKTKLSSSDKLNINKNIVDSNNTAIANNASTEKNSLKNLEKTSENTINIANTSKKNNTHIDTNKNELPLVVNKEKANTLIKETSKDNTAVANANDKTIDYTKTEENKRSIEDALNNAKKVIEKDNNNLKNRWSVAPNIAPVYFNTLKDGSSIDPQFNSNSKSGDINMSYGVYASYAINKKLSMRSGIHSVNLGYNTNDVVVFQSIGINTSSSALQNISPARDNISLISSETISSDTPTAIASSNASINQNLRYIEVPLEIQYTLSDKKFGVNLIGGFSSFFLNSNKVFYEEDNGNRTILGEASNINKLSYSANFGLGLNYKFSKKFNFNLEPLFKYQFNTFNNTSGDFSPFFIGVYTGFAVKF